MRVLDANISRCGYPGSFELRDVRIELEEGEVLLVTGRSGSGKTTLVRAITGTLKAAGGYLEGCVKILEQDIHSANPEFVFENVAYIPQEPWYALLGHTAYAEICHVLSLKGVSCCEADLVHFGLAGFAHEPVYTLSAGQVQRVLWADAVVKGAKLLVLDEPLVYMDEYSRKSALRVVEDAIQNEVSVIIVDHNPLVWKELEPKIMVLDSGRCVYYGGWTDDILSVGAGQIKASTRFPRDTIVSLRDVWFRYPGVKSYILRGFTAEFKGGVLTAVRGPNGSGKTTLLKLAAGILKPQRGEVRRLGRCIYIPENPLLYFTMPTAWEELFSAAGKDENRVLEVSEVLGLKSVLEKPLAKMSTGERRRVALASAFLYGADAYFVDEPTGGLDFESALQVLELIEVLLREGKAVVVATHDERFRRVADEVLELGVSG